jgi:phage tail sheath protein FI
MNYPGVYVTELQSSQHPITGVSTSVTAFVGAAAQGPVNSPQACNSWTGFVRVFGDLSPGNPMPYAVYQFFQAGGSTAIVVRVTSGDGKAAAAALTLPSKNNPDVVIEAASRGVWGDSLQAAVDYQTSDTTNKTLWNLTVQNTVTGATERYLNVSTDLTMAKSLPNVLQSSQLVQYVSGGSERPDVTPVGPPAEPVKAKKGNDGSPITDGDIDPESQTGGMYALNTVGIFNILCIPAPAPAAGEPQVDLLNATYSNAAQLCVAHRAMLIVDPPVSWGSVSGVLKNLTPDPATKRGGIPVTAAALAPSGQALSANAAMYFPAVTATDPLTGLNGIYPPCGAIAGVWAATDSARGVWKAPAGASAGLPGGMTPTVLMTDDDNGELNPLGIDCLRNFPVVGPVVWGARTLQGADVAESQWKYIPVRRTALYIEESLRRGTQWVVFEPNAEPLWASIRLNVGAFMAGLYRQGAFAGTTPSQAYLVKCDAENNPPDQVALGIVNILVGFAPLYPAEFVLISIEQLSGQG